MFQTSLRTAALLLCIGAVAALDDAVYMKVSDSRDNWDGVAGTTDNIESMRAVVKVALNDDSVPEIDHDDHVTWTHGKTKVDLEIEWSKASGDMWKKAMFGIAVKECSHSNVAASDHAYPAVTGIQPFRESLSQTRGHSTGSKGGKKVTYAIVRDYVISMPKAPCAYVVVNSQVQAKIPLQPSAPDFPATFHAGIESTHTNKGFTRYGSESYSNSCDAVSYGFYSSKEGFKRVIGDYESQKVWHIASANTTYPNGVCWSESMDDKPEFFKSVNGGMVSSAKFLGFATKDAQAQYIPGNGVTIRGVPTEQWAYKISKRPGSDVVERLTVHLYFSSPEWHFSKSTGHRVLQRVQISGHKDDLATNTSSKVETSYDYIDFMPSLPPWVSFEPCNIMPGGEGCECLNLGCKTTENTASAAPNSDASKQQEEQSAAATFVSPASCEAIGVAEKHRLGHLILICAIMMLIGAILTSAVTYLARKRHQKITAGDWKAPPGSHQPPPGSVFAPTFPNEAIPTDARPSDQYMEQ